MGFLSSFKSEFRQFSRVPITHGTNEIGERTPNEYTPIAILGVLLPENSGTEKSTGEIDFITESYKLYIETTTVLVKWDTVIDEDRVYEVAYIDPVYAFGGKKDHQLAILKRNK